MLRKQGALKIVSQNQGCLAIIISCISSISDVHQYHFWCIYQLYIWRALLGKYDVNTRKGALVFGLHFGLKYRSIHALKSVAYKLLPYMPLNNFFFFAQVAVFRFFYCVVGRM